MVTKCARAPGEARQRRDAACILMWEAFEEALVEGAALQVVAPGPIWGVRAHNVAGEAAGKLFWAGSEEEEEEEEAARAVVDTRPLQEEEGEAVGSSSRMSLWRINGTCSLEGRNDVLLMEEEKVAVAVVKKSYLD